MARGLSRSVACGIFPDPGLNLFAALTGRFFTSESPAQPFFPILKIVFSWGDGKGESKSSALWC